MMTEQQYKDQIRKRDILVRLLNRCTKKIAEHEHRVLHKDEIEYFERLQQIKDLIPIVFQKYGIEKSRKREFVYHRHAMMVFLIANTHLSLEAIGKLFDRDHATVIHGRENHNNFMQNKYASDYQSIWMRIRKEFSHLQSLNDRAQEVIYTMPVK